MRFNSFFLAISGFLIYFAQAYHNFTRYNEGSRGNSFFPGIGSFRIDINFGATDSCGKRAMKECSNGRCVPYSGTCCPGGGYCEAGTYCSNPGCCPIGKTCSGPLLDCGPGLDDCNGNCMPAGSVCCPGGGHCDAGDTCHMDGCCPFGKVCCPGGGYCDAGHTCTEEGKCRKSGGTGNAGGDAKRSTTSSQQQSRTASFSETTPPLGDLPEPTQALLTTTSSTSIRKGGEIDFEATLTPSTRAGDQTWTPTNRASATATLLSSNNICKRAKGGSGGGNSGGGGGSGDSDSGRSSGTTTKPGDDDGAAGCPSAAVRVLGRLSTCMVLVEVAVVAWGAAMLHAG
ncbi:hypothetical protein CT0861_00517 [Colletotrichum tofieldiae]|uniref:GPI anchored protein n=1 Tax=Colletotrichum tofieldiae TaxID=708197 RepID=A0A166LZ59_9PEZI|nr:hypothetical protein CT0861_00517 [Colletotrichum tofieldiae]